MTQLSLTENTAAQKADEKLLRETRQIAQEAVDSLVR